MAERPALDGAIRQLGELAATVDAGAVDEEVQAALDLVLFDTIGVTIAGARTEEMRALVDASSLASGPARLLGHPHEVAVEQAALLNGTAACVLELDEGNKHARGHPAAHVLAAVLALASERQVPGAELRSAFLAGHEVAARFGRSHRPRNGVHPHGHWGTTGAAAACARLLGCDPDATAAAIDAAAGLVLAPPFEAALAGSFVRNTWTGAANAHGLLAARLAEAGLASVDGTADHSLGGILGELDTRELTGDFRRSWDVTRGYLKRHAACSYTHPPADAALEIRACHPELDPAAITGILVETHGLAAPLARPDPPTRLAAMFSIPHVVAAALVHGEVSPSASSGAGRSDPDVRRLAAVTTVRRDPTLDARAPAERPARVSISLDSGRRLAMEVPNPVGDADHLPLGTDGVVSKLARLVGPEDTGAVMRALARLPDAPDARSVLAQLP